MVNYLWTGPSGFSATTRDITISTAGSYNLIISDLSGTATCSRNLVIDPELLPGSINTTLREFCTGGTAAIGGASPPYGPATGGSGSYNYTWQLQSGCSVNGQTFPGPILQVILLIAPAITTCYRRKVTDIVCNAEAWTDSKRFEIYEDPVSQTIVPEPADITVCAGSPVSATFTGGSGGFPGGTVDIYEYSTDSGATWDTYSPGQNISTTGLTGIDIVRIRTRRIPQVLTAVIMVRLLWWHGALILCQVRQRYIIVKDNRHNGYAVVRLCSCAVVSLRHCAFAPNPEI